MIISITILRIQMSSSIYWSVIENLELCQAKHAILLTQQWSCWFLSNHLSLSQLYYIIKLEIL